MRALPPRCRSLAIGLVLTGLAVTAAVGVPAVAAVPSTLHAGEAAARKCHAGRVTARSTDGFSLTSSVDGLIRVRLQPVGGADGDWDVAIFGAGGRLVAASAGPRSNEIADGYVRKGESLWVQGCRYAGTADRVRVTTEVVASALRAPADPDSSAISDLPSGRSSYRRLADYEYEMKELARRHPDLVKLDVLSHRSVEGRDIVAIEITQHAGDVADGKPIFLNLGLLHAREWPSGEQPMEFAYDLIKGYGHDARTTRLVQAARTIVLPVVNPDGFSVSRQAGRAGTYGEDPNPYADARKNCDPADAPTTRLRTGPCFASPAGTDRGVDLNRNFGVYWGGSGSSSTWGTETFRGSAPFSEPETQAVRDLASGRQITNVIGNHTAGDEVLRPPGVASGGLPVDDLLLSRLSRQLTANNRYADFRVYQNYDAGGGSDDWFYFVTGALSYTIESGAGGFRLPYADGVVAEYLGQTPSVGAGRGGNRGAYFAMLAATADSADHATLTGVAPKGWTLRLQKRVTTPTAAVQDDDGSTHPARQVTDAFDSTLRAPGGHFSWAVNPSTRPYVAGQYGRIPAAPAQAPIALINPPGQPALNENGDVDSGPREIIPFTVQAPPRADNGTVTVHLSWRDPDTSWFLFVVDDRGSLVAQSYPFGVTETDVQLINPLPGRYRAVIETYQQASTTRYDDWSGSIRFAAPTPPVAGAEEAWTLSCERPDGSRVTRREVVVARGQQLDVGTVCSRRAGPATTR